MISTCRHNILKETPILWLHTPMPKKELRFLQHQTQKPSSKAKEPRKDNNLHQAPAVVVVVKLPQEEVKRKRIKERM